MYIGPSGPVCSTESTPSRLLVRLHELFEATAARFPDRIAIDLPPGPGRPHRAQLPYAALLARAQLLAARIAPVAADDAVVAILLGRDTVELYVAQLAVLLAGAAFTCLDPAFPDDHLRGVVADARPVALLTTAAGRERLQAAGITLPVCVDPTTSDDAVIVPARSTDGAPTTAGADAALAYVIYTSGTTGKPKGVQIEHRAIVNLVEGDRAYFGLTSADRVAQCSSPAYDSSIEETWLAFGVGATLVLLDDATVRLGPDLVPWLKQERITVLCPTPTLLRTTGCERPREALPDLALIYIGGEALPQDLADRWAAGRWLENGYGPTECTVTVVRGRIQPGAPITIGQPIPGSTAHLLDEALQPVADGTPGELCIGGVVLARGYAHQPALTAERFPSHPALGRLYRTGDLVRRLPSGDLEYLGRIDAQVKVRGYRIELGAVEAALTSCPGIRAAACTVQGTGAQQLLVAHCVPEDAAEPPDVDALRARLRAALPSYMVPARIAFCDGLPTTVGGKLDRKALPEIAATGRTDTREIVAPRTATERHVAAAFAQVLRLTEPFAVTDDFFVALGGDSLSAVEVVTALRTTHATGCAVRDLYTARTVEALAALLDQRTAAPAPATSGIPPQATAAAHRTPSIGTAAPVWSTVLQGMWLLLELSVLSAAAWGFSTVVATWLRHDGLFRGLWWSALLSALLTVAYVPISVGATVLLKRLLIGRYRPMVAPVWSGWYTRHWIVTSAARRIPWRLLYGTPFAAVTLRALGARVGTNLHVHRGVELASGGWDLLTIGNDVTLAQDAAVRLVDLDAGQVVVGPITLEDGATIDVRGGLAAHTHVGANSYLTPLSWLAPGQAIPAGERWDGIPAGPAGLAPPAPVVPGRAPLPPLLIGAVHVTGWCLSALITGLTPIVAVLGWRVVDPMAARKAAAWLATPVVTAQALRGSGVLAAGAVVIMLLALAMLVRLGPSRPTVVHHASLTGVRIWFSTGLVNVASQWLSGSMYWGPWLRLAGMRVGRGAEISTIIDVLPGTVSVGGDSFFADGIYFCAPWRHRGTVTVARTSLGPDTFLGNHCVIPAGHDWPAGLFVGVSTVAPAEQALPHSAWFGQPPMALPRRDVVAVDRRLTFEPDLIRRLTRLFWETARLTLAVVPVMLAGLWYWGVTTLATQVAPWMLWGVVVPALTGATGLTLGIGVIILKWVLLGRMRPGQHAFWSCWCGRWDFLYVAWGLLARPWLRLLEGTLYLNAFLRATGVEIGRRVVLGRGFTQVVDPDMLHFADDSTITCNLQAHSFEDRVLKLDHIRVDAGATVGDNALLFYGAHVGAHADVAPHSVVMKRDRLAAATRYVGCPTHAESVS